MSNNQVKPEDGAQGEPQVRSSAVLACCPFCGKSDKDTHDYQPAVSLTQYPANRAFVVQCVWCGASGPVFGTAEEAIAEWNKAPRQHANADISDRR